MYDLISIGNISIDIFFQGESLTFKDKRFQLAVGGKYFADKVLETVGGGGANVAIGASNNGLKTAVFGKIGNNPFKKIIVDKLESAGVSTKLCQFPYDYLNISSILLSENGERAIIHYTSPHQHIITGKDELQKLSQTKAIYLGNLPDVSLTERTELLQHAKLKNILTVVNLGVKDCRREKKQIINFLKHVDILILNGHEFSDLVKAPYEDIHFHENIIKWYAPELFNKLVVITLGNKGSYCYFEGKIYHQPAIKIEKIIDTTGAGDGYVAGFISEFIVSKNIEKSMLSAAKYASKILQKIGGN